MRRWLVATAAVAAVTCLGAVALAQGGPGGGGGMRGQRGGMMGGGLGLLNIPVVQQDLKMTQAQIDKIPTKQQEVRAAMQELFQGGNFRDMTEEERAAMTTKMQQIQQKAVTDILDTTQQKRFKQIELQQAGLGVVLQRKDVATELKVTDEQKQKMRDVQQQARQEMQNLMPQGGMQAFQNMSQEERTKFMENMQKAREATNKKMLAVLTEAQQKQWATMLGTPIKLPAGGMFGGRRGPGGPGGGGGGGRGPGGL